MKMIFLGFASDKQALGYGEAAGVIGARPYGSDRVWEWK